MPLLTYLEAIRQGMLLVEEVHHLFLVHQEDGAVRRRRRTPHADRLTGQASFAKELARTEHRHDGFTPRLREHRKLDVPLLDVEDVLTRVALREDDLGSPIVHDLSRDPRRVEEGLSIEGAVLLRFHGEI